MPQPCIAWARCARSVSISTTRSGKSSRCWRARNAFSPIGCARRYPRIPRTLLAGGHARGARRAAARTTAPGARSSPSCGARPSRGSRRRWATNGTWRTRRSRSGTPRATQLEPFAEVIPALDKLKTRFRLATLSNGNADLGTIGLAHHFEVSLHAAALGCAKPDARAYDALARRTDTQTRGNTVCRRRTPRRCRRSAQRWHANCMGESRRVLYGPTALPAAEPCDRRPRRARGTGSRAKL